VIVHQTRVFAGATMEFQGTWIVHPKFGRQFKAKKAVEKKPATTAALEKYLGSGLIKGVGPKTAKKIVAHFKDQTLAIFETDIEKLTQVPGIAIKKLAMISDAWIRHRAIRQVMMFLQSHGISTLFAVRIYKEYGDNAITTVTEDPYRLAYDFYGIGFFSADKVALSIGLAKDSPRRIMAGIRHVLAAGRDFGHCYLTASQIASQVKKLLELDLENHLAHFLEQMEQNRDLMVRESTSLHGSAERCFYSRTLYFDEQYVAQKISNMKGPVAIDEQRVEQWITSYSQREKISLSPEQGNAIKNIAGKNFSILTGGPGCGKTTTTLMLVKLLEAMHKKVLLAAPTGRAAQRMIDVIGQESKTIHRLLEWKMGKFNKDQGNPLDTDFLIVDECSMLDISLTASLLKAVPPHGQVLFIGDADQLPSVGPGNVLRDMIDCGPIPCFWLTQVFRQARESLIIRYVHQINRGDIPHIDSPFKKPEIWRQKIDCLFLDSEEATKEQLSFVARVKKIKTVAPPEGSGQAGADADPYEFRINGSVVP